MKPLNKLTMQSFNDLLDELGDRGYKFERLEPYEYSYNGVMQAFTFYLRPVSKYPLTFNVDKDYIALLIIESENEIKRHIVMEYDLIPIKSIDRLIRIIDPDTRSDYQDYYDMDDEYNSDHQNCYDMDD